MANLVLYRKYRPKNFKEFIGQEHVVRTITNEISSGNISHAYLFSGHRGTGKTSLARLFAKAINCQNPKGFEPCNKCLACKEINEGRSIDLVEIDAASNRGIEEIRSIRESIKFSPSFLKYKVLILDEAHQLSKDAANALLKMLEEPPSYAIFILATTEMHKMIPTIASRCQRFDFYKFGFSTITEKLSDVCKEEGIKAEKKALDLIASNASGSLRDALGILNQAQSFVDSKELKSEDIVSILGLVDINLVVEFVNYLAKKDKVKAIKFLNDNLEKGLDISEFNKNLIDYLRKLLILKIDKDLLNQIMAGEPQDTQKKAQEQADQFDSIQIRKLLKLFLDTENRIKYASIIQLPLELAIVEFCS